MSSDLDLALTFAPIGAVRGRTIFGFCPTTGQFVPVNVDPTGHIIPTPPSAVALGPTPPDTALPPGGMVLLPVGPVGTTQQIVQNIGGPGSEFRVREAGGAAGTGIVIVNRGIFIFDGGFALEAEDLAGLGSSIVVTWES